MHVFRMICCKSGISGLLASLCTTSVRGCAVACLRSCESRMIQRVIAVEALLGRSKSLEQAQHDHEEKLSVLPVPT